MGSEIRHILGKPARHVAAPLILGVALFAAVLAFVWQSGYFAGSEAKDPPALVVLKHLRAAELAHRRAHGRYAGLDALRAEGASAVAEGETEPSSRYRFTSEVGPGRYTIRAVPPKPGMPALVLETGYISRPPRPG